MSPCEIAQHSLCFNGEDHPWAPALSLATLLAARGVCAESVSTAVNGHFVAREQRALTTLQPGDVVLTFEAIVGG